MKSKMTNVANKIGFTMILSILLFLASFVCVSNHAKAFEGALAGTNTKGVTVYQVTGTWASQPEYAGTVNTDMVVLSEIDKSRMYIEKAQWEKYIDGYWVTVSDKTFGNGRYRYVLQICMKESDDLLDPFAEFIVDNEEWMNFYGANGYDFDDSFHYYCSPEFWLVNPCKHTNLTYHPCTATCTEDGIKTYYSCECGFYCEDIDTLSVIDDLEAWMKGEGVQPAFGHQKKTTVTAATFRDNGKKVVKCSTCGEVFQKTTIDKISSVLLSKDRYVYDGKVKTPVLQIKDAKDNTVSSQYYTVKKDSGRKKVGQYGYTIKFKGYYAGTKSVHFQIVPGKTTLVSLQGVAKGFRAVWKKQTLQTTGYQLQYSTNPSLQNAKTVSISKNTTTEKTVSKLTVKQKYYVRVRTYKVVNGKKIYSDWSGVKEVVTKK